MFNVYKIPAFSKTWCYLFFSDCVVSVTVPGNYYYCKTLVQWHLEGFCFVLFFWVEYIPTNLNIWCCLYINLEYFILVIFYLVNEKTDFEKVNLDIYSTFSKFVPLFFDLCIFILEISKVYRLTSPEYENEFNNIFVLVIFD